MSFGILDLKRKDDLAELKGKKKQLKAIVTGNTLSSFLMTHHLVQQFGSEAVIWVSSKKIDIYDFIRSWEHQLPLIRGEATAAGVKQLVPELELTEFEKEPLFYKDQSLKSFEGRAKPHKMLFIEEDFVAKNYTYDLLTFIAKYSSSAKDPENKEVSSIEKDEQGWKLRFADGDLYQAEMLYWGDSRKDYYDRLSFELEQSLSKEEKDSLLCFGDLSLLAVKFELSKSLQNEGQTYFIPQSFTHDHGHFIFDFLPAKEGKQTVFGSFFIDSDSMDKEEIGRRIRKLKRAIERIYPDFSQQVTSQEVKVLEHLFPQLRENFETDPLKQTEKLPYFIGSYAARKEQFAECEFPFVVNVLSSFVDYAQENPLN